MIYKTSGIIVSIPIYQFYIPKLKNKKGIIKWFSTIPFIQVMNSCYSIKRGLVSQQVVLSPFHEVQTTALSSGGGE